jgi:hypothetical protein
MPSLHRLEDLTRDWQKHCAGLLDQALQNLSARLETDLPDPVNAQSPEVVARVAETARRETRRFCEAELLPACLDWLQATDHWPNRTANLQRVRVELTSALENLPGLQPVLPPASYTLSPWGWVIPAGGGAALGALLLTPLSLLLFGNREIGLFVGGVVGALVLVSVLALLATRPKLLAAVRTSLAAAGAVSLGGGLWQAVRGRSTGWLRAALYFLAAWLIVLTVRPRLQLPSRRDCLEDLRHQLRALLQQDADLILGWCWAHPERLAPAPVSAASGDALPEPVCAALAALRGVLAPGNVSPEDLHEAAGALLQRVEEQGYEWKTVERGTPYAEAMEREFDRFALIGPGQPVETLRPAFLRRGEVVQRGLLRRLST